eukprot:Opistho-1_new@58580
MAHHMGIGGGYMPALWYNTMQPQPPQPQQQQPQQPQPVGQPARKAPPPAGAPGTLPDMSGANAVRKPISAVIGPAKKTKTGAFGYKEDGDVGVDDYDPTGASQAGQQFYYPPQSPSQQAHMGMYGNPNSAPSSIDLSQGNPSMQPSLPPSVLGGAPRGGMVPGLGGAPVGLYQNAPGLPGAAAAAAAQAQAQYNTQRLQMQQQQPMPGGMLGPSAIRGVGSVGVGSVAPGGLVGTNAAAAAAAAARGMQAAPRAMSAQPGPAMSMARGPSVGGALTAAQLGMGGQGLVQTPQSQPQPQPGQPGQQPQAVQQGRAVGPAAGMLGFGVRLGAGTGQGVMGLAGAGGGSYSPSSELFAVMGKGRDLQGLDVGDFPALGGRAGTATITSNYNEDFPALPGSFKTGDGDSSGSMDTILGSMQAHVGQGQPLYGKGQGFPNGFSVDGRPGFEGVRKESFSEGQKEGSPHDQQADRFGLLGLLNVIRMTEQDLNTLAIGSDLTSLGLNLNSPESLYTTFSSPWADAPSARPKDPEYCLPPCYYQTNHVPAPTSKMSLLTEETLFYIFYAMPRDALQQAAAAELFQRDWRYHKELRLWFARVASVEPMKTPTHERGTYVYFDVASWQKVRKDFVIAYDQLEGGDRAPFRTAGIVI